MILKFSGLTKKESGGGTIPPIPPIEPEAVNGISFLRDGTENELVVSQVIDQTPRKIKAFVFSGFFRAAPKEANDEPFYFFINGEQRIRVHFTFASSDPDLTRDGNFTIEVTNPDGSVFGYAYQNRPIFLRENSWHHLFLDIVINDTDTGFSRAVLRINTIALSRYGQTFTDTDAPFIGQDFSTGFGFSTRTEAKYACFEPSLAHCYCEVSDTNNIVTTFEDFINTTTGAPIQITNPVGGEPIFYFAVDGNEGLRNYINNELFELSTQDWHAEEIEGEVTLVYGGKQHTNLAAKQSESYTGYAHAEAFPFLIAPATPESYLNIWFGDFFEDRGEGCLVCFSTDANEYLFIEFTPAGDCNVYMGVAAGNGFSWTTPRTLEGWLNVSLYTPPVLGDDLTIKFNDEAPITLTNPTVITNPPLAYSRFSFFASTPTQALGAGYFYGATIIGANPGIDFTDLNALFPNFVNEAGEPIWNGLNGAGALGFKPGIFLNPAIGTGGLSCYGASMGAGSSVIQPLGGYTGKCTYFNQEHPGVASTANGSRAPFELFNEITFKA